MNTPKLLTLIFLGGFITFITSCSKPDQHLNTIPSSSQIIGSVNILSFTKKGELYDMEQYAYYDKMMEKLKTKNPDLHQFVQKIISNPLQTGIRYRDDLFFFTENLNKQPYMGITMSLRNPEDFEEFISQLLSNTHNKMTLTKKNGLSYTSKENMMLIFDNQKMLMVAKAGAKKEALFNYCKTLMNQDKQTSIKSHSDFKTFNKTKQDLNLWLALNQLPQSSQFAIIQNQLPFKLTENYLHTHVDFKDDGIFGTASVSFNEEIQKIIESYQFNKKAFNTNLLKYLPEENYFSLGFAINPMSFYKYLNDIPSYKQMLEHAGKGSPLSVEKFLKSLDGDIMMALHGVKTLNHTDTSKTNQQIKITPYATFIASMNDNEIYETITTQLIPQNMFQKKNNYYSGNFDGFNVYFGLFDNNLIVTNDENIITNAPRGGLKNNLKNTSLKELFSHSFFMYTNLDWNQYPENIHNKVQKKLNTKEKSAFAKATNVFKEIRLYSPEINKSKLEFIMKNTDGNALHTLLMLLDEIAQDIKVTEKSKNDIVASAQ